MGNGFPSPDFGWIKAEFAVLGPVKERKCLSVPEGKEGLSPWFIYHFIF